MNISKITLSLVALLTVSLAIAQPAPPPATPIDGGLSLLLAAGGIYGIKKLKQRYNEK
jgi:hypothetical protein